MRQGGRIYNMNYQDISDTESPAQHWLLIGTVVLITLFILTMASGAWASQDLTINGTRVIVSTTMCVSPSMQVSCHPGEELDQWHIEIVDPCLAKMEAAMRAMEPFTVNEWVNQVNFDGWTQLALDKYHAANVQWEEALTCRKE